MPYEITVNHNQQLIEIHVMGESNPLEALEARNRTALIAAELGFHRIMVYGSQLEKVQGFSPAMILSYATSFRDKPFPVGTKFAIIPPRFNEPIKALVKIARKHGTRMRLFNDAQLAIDWLSGVLATADLQPL